MISERYKLIIDDIRELTRPLFLHYSKGDFPGCAERITELLTPDRLMGLEPDASEVQECYLRFLQLAVQQSIDGKWNCDEVTSAITWLSQPLQTGLGNHQRINTLLQLRAYVGDGCGPGMTQAEFRELLRHEHLLEISSHLWDSVGLWAYRTGQMDLLEEAFENLTISPANVMPQESWQRLNLMFQLRRGSASRRDIEEYIRLMRMVPQILEFRMEMQPRAEQLGIWDEELQAAVEERMQHAREQGYNIRTERRTGKIRS
ncbi:hypothetical protein KDL44_09085 [bacterium]|nr:hypothetical protein [bacterium]